jgi:hypothetical protein
MICGRGRNEPSAAFNMAMALGHPQAVSHLGRLGSLPDLGVPHRRGRVPAPVVLRPPGGGHPMQNHAEADRQHHDPDDQVLLGSPLVATISANTIDASPRGPNQPM